MALTPPMLLHSTPFSFLFSRARIELADRLFIKKPAALSVRLYPNSTLASRHPLGVLRQADKVAWALAVPASQHMLGLSPHPGVSYLFQNQTHITPADEALWNGALGSTALGGGVLNRRLRSSTPTLGEFVLKVDSKFKVRNSQCVVDVWMLRYIA